MQKDDEYESQRIINAQNAWAEIIAEEPDKYDNMLVKNYRAEMEQFLKKYDEEHPADVDEYISNNEVECYRAVEEENEFYLDDERDNLGDIKPNGKIVIFGHLALWNGSPAVAATSDKLKTVSDCLQRTHMQAGTDTEIEYYVSDGDFQCRESHHDSGKSANHYTFRLFSPDMDDDEIEDILYKCKEKNDFTLIYENTESLAPEICKVYGWDYEPNQYDLVLPGEDKNRK